MAEWDLFVFLLRIVVFRVLGQVNYRPPATGPRVFLRDDSLLEDTRGFHSRKYSPCEDAFRPDLEFSKETVVRLNGWSSARVTLALQGLVSALR